MIGWTESSGTFFGPRNIHRESHKFSHGGGIIKPQMVGFDCLWPAVEFSHKTGTQARSRHESVVGSKSQLRTQVRRCLPLIFFVINKGELWIENC